VRIIRVSYRASFEFPLPETPLSPSGWWCPGEIVLEVFESSGNTWKMRNQDGKEITHWKWSGPSAQFVKNAVEASFEKQLKPWVMIGDGKRELAPEEVEILETSGRSIVYLLEAEDLERKKANKV
jgi:hypothetical protein